MGHILITVHVDQVKVKARDFDDSV
jgi:hypothetical protein